MKKKTQEEGKRASLLWKSELVTLREGIHYSGSLCFRQWILSIHILYGHQLSTFTNFFYSLISGTVKAYLYYTLFNLKNSLSSHQTAVNKLFPWSFNPVF